MRHGRYISHGDRSGDRRCLAGIKQLELKIGADDEAVRRIDGLFVWLLGRVQTLRFGIAFNTRYTTPHTTFYNQFPFSAVAMRGLSSRLLSLEVRSNDSIWATIFQLTALTRLRLDLMTSRPEVQPQLPQLPQLCTLPNLATLEVLSHTCLRPLLGSSQLPALKKLSLVSLGYCDWVPAALGSLSKLEDLNLDTYEMDEVSTVCPCDLPCAMCPLGP